MDNLPIAIKLNKIKCLVIGGGNTALEKINKLLSFNANIDVITQVACADIEHLGNTNQIHLSRRSVHKSDINHQYQLIISATNNIALTQSLYNESKQQGILFNSADMPDYCDFYLTSVARHKDISIGISSNGISPTITQYLRDQINNLLSDLPATLLTEMHKLRTYAKQTLITFNDKKHYLQRQFAELMKQHWQQQFGFTRGSVLLVGCGPGHDSLYTMAAIQAIKAADCIIYDSLVQLASFKNYMEFDTPCTITGKKATPCLQAQDNINQLLINEAQKGRFVVRLKGGDPSFFARTMEEISAFQAAKIPYHIIAGVTAASAAGAVLNTGLSLRKEILSISFITASFSHPDQDIHAILDQFNDQSSLVIYMPLHKINAIIAALLQNGAHPTTPIAILSAISLPSQSCIVGTLTNIKTKLKEYKPKSPGIVVVSKLIEHSTLIDNAATIN